MEWKFNINEIEKILQNNFRLTSQDKVFFKNYLKGVYDYPQISTYNFDNSMTFDEAKIHIIECSKDLFKGYNNKYLEFIIKLYEDSVFNINNNSDNNLLDFDEIVRVVLFNYEKYMPSLSDKLNKYIYNKNCHIELMDNDISSYQYTPKDEDPFILINPKDGNGVLSYYLQEGIEEMIPMGYTFEDDELGPLVFRLLFHDRLFEEDGVKYSTDYLELIDTINLCIKEAYPFILFSKELKEYNYELSDIEFSNLYNKYFNSNIETFNRKSIFRKLNWLTSCLHAIEIRCIAHNNSDVLGILVSNVDFIYNDSRLTLYKKYVEEINNKCTK